MANYSISMAGDAGEILQRYYIEAPKVVMDVIHGEGAEIAKGHIRDLIPVSDRNKQHAASNARFKQNNLNLSTELIIGGKYGYLVFPDEGIGAHNPIAQEFMKDGVMQSLDDVCLIINSRVSAL